MRNARNGGLWPDADVFVGGVTATIPLKGAAPSTTGATGWKDVGILSGEEGFEAGREQDTSEVFGWGGILVDSATRNFRTTRAFTVMEENEQTMGLVWPGSTLEWTAAAGATGGVDVYEGDLVQPDSSKEFRLGFVQRKGNIVRVAYTRGFAKLAEVEVTEGGEDDAFQATVTCNIFPDATGRYFYVYRGPIVTP